MCAEGRTSARARKGSALHLRGRQLAPPPVKESASSRRVTPFSVLGALGGVTLAALGMSAAGIDLIHSAVARNAPPLGFLAAGPGQLAGAATRVHAPAAVMPAVPARVTLVFSLSQAPARDERQSRPEGSTLASASPRYSWEASWQEVGVAPDRITDVPSHHPPAIVRPPTPPAGEAVPPAPVLKPRAVAHLGRTDSPPYGMQEFRVTETSAADVIARFESVGYELDQVRRAQRPVPRLYLAALPRDLANVPSANARKRLFVQAVLPAILRVNEEIAAARWRVERLGDRLIWPDALTPADREWLVDTANLYGAVPFDVPGLLSRMDIVPPSLALAQAAEESGWGTSRFVREGNALFGQYTYNSKPGMVPAQRDENRRHRVRSHDTLLDAVRAYAHNLNSHWAYDDFRLKRSRLRRAGAAITGDALVGELWGYSERRAAYVESIRRIMRQNRLGDFDRSWLYNRQWTAAVSPQNKRPPI